MAVLALQVLGGMAAGSVLFLVASGLSLIFGVTRIVNFAHGAFTMLGAYLAWTLQDRWIGAGGLGCLAAALVAALVVGALGGVVERGLLRRLYGGPELFPLLGTFGLSLVIQDAVLAVWGPDDLLGRRVPGLNFAVPILGQAFPAYDLFLIVLGPVVLCGLWLLFQRTAWGMQVRAAAENRPLAAALGLDERRLMRQVVMLGAALAGFGGALLVPRGTVNHQMDLSLVVEAFVVVVVGGMGSVPGAFLAAQLIGILEAVSILVLPRITLVLLFLVMAVVLVLRPHGLLGQPQPPGHSAGQGTGAPPGAGAGTHRGDLLLLGALSLLALLPWTGSTYLLLLGSEVLILALLAAAVHFLMAVGGLVSFGHAAYFGLGAYGAALAATRLGTSFLPALAAGIVTAGAAAALFGWLCVRRSGVYLAMLSLACAQLAWSVVFQWSTLTGGDNGILGLWPQDWAASPAAFFRVTLVLCGAGLLTLRRIASAPHGAALRAGRDSPLRAAAVGIAVERHHWLAFTLSGLAAGLAGGLHAFAQGSVFPAVLGVSVSVEALVMALLGGLELLTAPLPGAALFHGFKAEMMRVSDSWQFLLGASIMVLVLVLPQGLAGLCRGRIRGWRGRRPPAPSPPPPPPPPP